MHGFGLDEQTALDLLRSEYNPRCEPPWSDAELLHKVSDAANKPHEKPWGWLRDSAPRPLAPSAERAARGGEERGNGRPRVVIDTDEHRVIEETVSALQADPHIFQRGMVLVQVIHPDADSPIAQAESRLPSIRLLPRSTLREHMTRHADFVTVSPSGIGYVPAHPREWLVKGVESRADWPGIRELRGISDTPILRPDGTIFQTPGYDPLTGIMYSPSQPFEAIPEDVDLDDADAVRTELLGIVEDFPFASLAHRSGWFAGLLTPFARSAFVGNAPLFLFDANVRGAGKSLLTQVIGCITLGGDMPVTSYSHDAEEMRKKITAIAISGDRVVNLDNLNGVFGNDAIDRVVTASVWSDRLLGKSQVITVPMSAVWYASGNNVAVKADTTRRIIHIRLDAMQERPEEREGFKHPDLLAWVRQERQRFVRCVLIILRAYCRAGMPDQHLASFGSFEGWSRVVRGALVWIGETDPCETRAGLIETSDSNAEVMGQFLEALHAYLRDHPELNNRIVVTTLLPRLYGRDGAYVDPVTASLRSAIEGLCGTPSGKTPLARVFGNRLKKHRSRIINEKHISLDSQAGRRQGAVWVLHAKEEELLV